MQDQINSLHHFQQHSRLHFIGQWKTQMEEELRRWFAEHPEWNHGSLEQQRSFIHVDLDAFFCSVQLAKEENAHLRTMPVGIAAGKFNSDISSCNYVARSLGVSAGMYVNAAKERCPDLVVLGYDLETCATVAKALYRIIFESFPSSFNMSLEVYSIDEVMLATDTTDYAALGSFCEKVRQELVSLTGCTASCGIGPNIMLARVATEQAKPDGIKLIAPTEVPKIMLQLRFDRIHGAGEVTIQKIFQALRQRGQIRSTKAMHAVTCGDVQQLAREELQQLLGKRLGESFYHLIRGEDTRVVTRTGDPENQRRLGKGIPSSVGCSMNYAVRPHSISDVWDLILQVLGDVCAKLRRTNTEALALRLTLLERHPLHAKQTQKFMGRGKCVEAHLTVKLPHPMGEESKGSMFTALQDVVRPLLVEQRAITDEERAAQLGLTNGRADQVIWTVTLSSLKDIIISDIRGLTIQATGLRLRNAQSATRPGTGPQITLAAAFSRAKRRRTEELVQQVGSNSPDGPEVIETMIPSTPPSECEKLYASYLMPWGDEFLQTWSAGCTAACEVVDYPLVKAYLRCALLKLLECTDSKWGCDEFDRLVLQTNARLPVPVSFW